MSASETLQIIRDLLAIIALVVGAGFAAVVYEQFAPVVRLRITPTWCDKSRRLLDLRFEVENQSRVRAYVDKVLIQVLEHVPDERPFWSEWVPLSREAIRPAEQPVEWREPDRVMESTMVIRPGETVSIERIYHYPQPSLLIHAGLQVRLKTGFLGRLSGPRRKRFQQTVTCYVIREIDAPDGS